MSVPPLEERTPEEKKELLLYFFKREARKNGRKIFIGTSVFHRMMDYVYAGNVAQLKNCVRSCCANAFLYSDADAESLYVYQYHLPEEILAASRADPAAENEQESLISINEYEKLDAVDIFVRFYDSILGCFARQAGEEASLGGVFERCYAYINSFMDYLYFDKKHTNSRFNAIKQVVDGVLEAVSEKYHAVLPVHCGFLISRGLHAQMQRNLTLQRWLERRDAELEGALGTLRRTSPGEMTIALEASELIGQNMDLRISKMDLLLLALNIKYSNKGVQVSAIRGVIACRGYATASSMAETVNKLIGRHTFDAIDLPVNAGRGGPRGAAGEVHPQAADVPGVHPALRHRVDGGGRRGGGRDREHPARAGGQRLHRAGACGRQGHLERAGDRHDPQERLRGRGARLPGARQPAQAGGGRLYERRRHRRGRTDDRPFQRQPAAPDRNGGDRL